MRFKCSGLDQESLEEIKLVLAKKELKERAIRFIKSAEMDAIGARDWLWGQFELIMSPEEAMMEIEGVVGEFFRLEDFLSGDDE